MVFSGIVQGTGHVCKVKPLNGKSQKDGLTIQIDHSLDDGGSIYIGCSIAVNGVCLTATSFSIGTFTVDLAPETLRLTNLCSLSSADQVNLELALGSSARNSGHYVQGHVDGLGKIISKIQDGESLRVRISAPDLITGIVHKGYIAVDGASLTVTKVDYHQGWFELMLIPHTRSVIRSWQVGDHVNLEVDCLGKYISQAVLARSSKTYMMTSLSLSVLALGLSFVALLSSRRSA